jgi:hypothetical protein
MQHSCRAYDAPAAACAALLPGVSWVDASNVWHQGDEPPECLVAARSVEGVRFAAVEVSIEGSTWRPVVWIDCRSAVE